MGKRIMTAALSLLRRAERAIGRSGLGALLVLAGTAAFHLLAVMPLKAEIAELRVQADGLQATAQQARRAKAAPEGVEQLQTFYGLIPAIGEAPLLLNEVFGTAARSGVRIDASHYRIVEGKGGRITRYEITLPVTGSYVQVRNFVAFVLSYVPSLSLDAVAIRKDKIDDGEVRADIRMTLYLERAP